MSEALPHYVFVGAFKATASDGSVGGQTHACTSLVTSRLSQFVRWTLIDSTMEGVGDRPLSRRAFYACRRLVQFAGKVARRDVDGALLFSSYGLSFIEKGVMALVAKGLGRRVVLSPRSGLLLDDLERSSFMRWFVPFVFRRCDVVICQGQSWAHRYKQISRHANTTFAVIPNWIDTEAYTIRQRTEAAPGVTRFLYLGRLETYKGILDLVEAVGRYRHQLEGAKFVICGRGRAESGARARTRRLGVEQFFDFRGWELADTKLETIARSDVLVLPSHREGLPNSLLEGMAAGLAVITTPVGGVPDIITSDHVGLCVEPGNVTALGAALVTLHTDPVRQRALATAGRAHVRDHDIDRVWPLFMDLLKLRSDSREACSNTSQANATIQQPPVHTPLPLDKPTSEERGLLGS